MTRGLAAAAGANVRRANAAMMVPLVDLRQLRYCLAAVDQGSFRKAAIRLGVRESTVSRRIRDLEGLLGTALFIRHPAGIRLTEAGQRFGRQARHIFQAIEAAVEEVGMNRAEPGGDDRSDVTLPAPPIASACLVCWGAHYPARGRMWALLPRKISRSTRPSAERQGGRARGNDAQARRDAGSRAGP